MLARAHVGDDIRVCGVTAGRRRGQSTASAPSGEATASLMKNTRAFSKTAGRGARRSPRSAATRKSIAGRRTIPKNALDGYGGPRAPSTAPPAHAPKTLGTSRACQSPQPTRRRTGRHRCAHRCRHAASQASVPRRPPAHDHDGIDVRDPPRTQAAAARGPAQPAHGKRKKKRVLGMSTA